jgi:hypothetical protein
MRGEPQPARFRTAAQTRTRLTLRPLRELIDEVRMEPDTGDG